MGAFSLFYFCGGMMWIGKFSLALILIQAYFSGKFAGDSDWSWFVFSIVVGCVTLLMNVLPADFLNRKINSFF